MASTMTPAAEAGLAETARRMAIHLDAHWDARTSAARDLDQVVADLGAGERGDPTALLEAVRRAQQVLAGASIHLAPEGVRHG